MAKQTFTTGDVLTATAMNDLQANDYNWTVSQKTASYVLVAADKGTRIEMNSASSTTVTVNTGLFTAGDSVIIQNIGAGMCTVTAGTATVNKATNASLALAQYQGGTLYFVSASSAIFFPFDVGGVSKVVQIVSATTTTSVNITSTSLTDTNLTATITPTSASNNILIFLSQWYFLNGSVDTGEARVVLLRGATTIHQSGTGTVAPYMNIATSATESGVQIAGSMAIIHSDSPATTSATTYKTQAAIASGDNIYFQNDSGRSTIILMEVTP